MVNYPHKLSSKKKREVTSQTKNFANRGMTFEKMINATNDYYLTHGLAVIHKKPTPVQIVRVDYPQRSRAKIVEAYFRQASTTDYSGVYEGFYIDFEAKETKQKHAIPMKNFHPHQIRHMEQVLEQKGICFVLLHFKKRIYCRHLTSSVFIIRIWGKSQCRLTISKNSVMLLSSLLFHKFLTLIQSNNIY